MPDEQAIAQTFVVSHLEDSEFKPGGFRDHNVYRDLGVTAATGGRVKAHVVRAITASTPGKTGGRHKHLLDFQFVYLLKGWQTMRIAGVEGIVTMREGSSWIQPPGIAHEVIAFSADREALEVTMPAQYETLPA